MCLETRLPTLRIGIRVEELGAIHVIVARATIKNCTCLQMRTIIKSSFHLPFKAPISDFTIGFVHLRDINAEALHRWYTELGGSQNYYWCILPNYQTLMKWIELACLLFKNVIWFIWEIVKPKSAVGFHPCRGKFGIQLFACRSHSSPVVTNLCTSTSESTVDDIRITQLEQQLIWYRRLNFCQIEESF